MKWYTAISSYSPQDAIDQLEAAIYTCIKNTPFKPNIIIDKPFDGSSYLSNKFKNVNFIYYNSEIVNSFLKEFNGEPEKYYVSAAYLRTEIPQIESTDKYILYTDIDVLFLNPDKKIKSLIKPDYFLVTPEFDPNNWTRINTGTLIMNVENLRKNYPAFKKHIMSNFRRLFNDAHDQTAYIELYHNKWQKLPLEYNWKPYWGINDNAQILHFHGAKPHLINKYFTGDKKTLPNIIQQLIMSNESAYTHYNKMYDDILNEARNK